MKTLVIIHGGKAYYPEVEAYKSFFSKYFKVDVLVSSAFDISTDNQYDVAIVIMGYYPIRPNAKFVIHDYRSASVGKFNKIKDIFKTKVYKPNLRVFLSKEVENFIYGTNFNDSCYIKMGVPDYFICSEPKENLEHDCCYVGDVNDERNFDEYINLHVRDYSDRSLICIGNVQESYFKYQSSKIIFLGKKSHQDVLGYILRSKVCVSHIPKHLPYSIQYSTKMIEYAAAGKPVIANISGSNIITARDYGVSPIYYDTKLPLFDEINYMCSDGMVSQDFAWDSIIEQSGIVNVLRMNNVF